MPAQKRGRGGAAYHVATAGAGAESAGSPQGAFAEARGHVGLAKRRDHLLVKAYELFLRSPGSR